MKESGDDSLEQIEFFSLDANIKQEREVNFEMEFPVEINCIDETVYDESSDESSDEDNESSSESSRSDLNVCTKSGCGKKFTDRSLLKIHEKKHLKKSHQTTRKEINQKCAECGLIFKSSQNLSEHRAFTHGAGDIFCCDYCGKLFFSRVMLMSHQKCHKVVKKNKCSICSLEFIDKYRLKTHLRRVHKMNENEIFEIFK